ncbi:MAG: uracil-DNA glycosylase [Chloroflexi bacterium]|nr:uracil-DNA glycosylase [Chloroflexota bacterium]
MSEEASHPADALRALNRRLVACRQCPRLVAHREQAGLAKKPAFREWDYWSRPVPGFGDVEAKVVIVGMAPAAHGGNRTGRMFTGDASARFLMQGLHQAGFANQPTSEEAGDGLELRGAYLTAAARCAPPLDRLTREELVRCEPYLREELAFLTEARILLALGRVAFVACLKVAAQDGARPLPLPFQHGARYELHGHPPRVLYASYHPSPRNHQTGRLSPESFLEVLLRVRQEADTFGAEVNIQAADPGKRG